MSVDVVDGQTLTVAENSLNGTVVGTPTVTQTTPGPLTYAIIAGNESNAFLINPVSGEIRVADGSQLDFETKPSWQLTVEAFLNSDPTQRDSSTVNIAVGDVSGAKTVGISGAATLSMVGGRITVADSGGTTLYAAGVEDVTSLTINGSAAADTLTVDFTGGNPLPAGGLTFNGLAQPVGGAGDALVLQGGVFDRIDYRYDNGHDGGLSLTLGAMTSTIEYQGLEPIINTGTAADMTFTLSTAADNAVLEQIAPGTLRLRSTDAAPTFEATTFAAPTTSLSIFGNDGADTIRVTPITATFALTIDGQIGDDVLTIDQTDAPLVAPAFTFAGFNFIQSATPDQAVALAGLLDGGHGVNVNAPLGSTIVANLFPNSTVGFNSALSIGRLLNPGLTTDTRGINMPASNVGTVDRTGFSVSWSSGTLSEQAGDDFVIYESGDLNEPDAFMVQVKVVGGTWSKWRYETADSFAPYGGVGTAGTFATAFDLADFGLTAGQSIEEIRVVSMTAADRMEGPGAERVTGSGVFVASGFVIPNDNGLTSDVLPDPGATAKFSYYGNATFDPDPLYIGALHPLATAGSDSDDVLTVNGTTITTVHGTSAGPSITYSDFAELRVNTYGGADSVEIDVGAGGPATVRVDAGAPTSQDSLKINGMTGGQTFTLTGTTISDGTTTVHVSGVESLTMDVSTVGAGDTVNIDRSFALSGNAPAISVIGGGTGDNDQLTVNTEFPATTPTAAETFSFATVSFNESSTPNELSELGVGTLVGGHGVVITTRPLNSGPTPPTTITAFPDSTLGFNAALSLGALWERSSPTTPRFVNLPDGTNNGTAARAGLALSWTGGRTVANGAGTDFVVFESGADGGGPDAFMVQVHDAETGVWSDWVYKKATSSANYGGGLAYATQFDLVTDFGVAGSVDAIRIANLTAADGVVSNTGEGKVVIGGGPGTFAPLDPSGNPFTATGYDPDLLYFGVRQPLTTSTPSDDVVDVDADSVDVTGYLSIDHAGLTSLTVNTGGGADVITAAPSADTAYTLNAGSPGITTNPGDRVVFDLAGVTAPQFTSTGIGAGTLAATGRAAVLVTGVDSLGASPRMDVVVSEAANSNGLADDEFSVVRNGASDEITVNGQLVLRVDREAVETLFIVGGDTVDDQLTIDLTNGSPSPNSGISFAAGVGGSDALRFTGATVTTVTQTYFNAVSGSTAIDASLFTYDEIENVTDDLVAANRNFVFQSLGNTIDLSDDTSLAGRSQITSNNGATTRFNNPTATLTLFAGLGDDTVTLDELDAAFSAAVTIRGETGDDDIAIDDNGRNVAGGTVDWIRFPLTIDGGGQTEDRLTIDDTGSTRDKTYSVSNVQIGGDAVPAGAAVAIPGVVPNVNGTIDGAEWDQVPVAFDSGPRPASNAQSILHFNFTVNGGATTADSTGNNNTGLLVEPPGPQFRVSSGKFGGALEFDGVDDYAWFQDLLFNVGNAGTLNFWVQMDDVSKRNQFFEGPGDAGMEMQYRPDNGGQFYGRATTAGGDVALSAGGDASAAGVWTNLQLTWDFATKVMRVYRNGAEVTYASGRDQNISGWTTLVNTVNQMMYVGRDPGDNARFFDGKMDDVAWFNTVLTPSERNALRTVGVEAAQADVAGINSTGRLNAIGGSGNLVAYWNLDDAPGTTVVTGDGGTSIVLYTTPPLPQFVVNGGRFGGALEFDGQNNYATFQDASFDVGTRGSLSFWVRLDTVTGKRHQFFEGPGDGGFEMQFRTNGSGQFYGRVQTNGDFVIRNTNDNNSVGVWTNLQYTWDFASGQMRIYRDGVESLYASGFTPTDLTWTTVTSTANQVINVGRDPGDALRFVDGRMDDIAWFNDVLTPAERNALAGVGQTAKSVGDAQALMGTGQVNASGRLNSVANGGTLVAYWNLDDPVGTTLVAGDGGTNIVLKLGPQTEGAEFVAGGGPTLPSGGPPLNAVLFDGDKDSIRVADSTSLDFAKTQGSISFWVRPDQLTVDNTANGYIALVEDSNQQIFVGISRQSGSLGSIIFSPFENTPASNQNIIVSDTRLTVGQWKQVTVTWDFATRTASIYINGALDTALINNTTNPAIWTQAAGNTGDWIFGADGRTQAHGLTGAMAEIAVYGNALRAGEVQSLYQTGATNSGSFDLAGARGRFTWDADYVYGLIESYTAGPGTANGPFDDLEIELYINNGTTPVTAALTVAPGGTDVPLYEFRILRTDINDGAQAFNPEAGDYLRYRVRTIDGDVAGSGFDTRDTTLGWVVEPPLTPDGLRRLDFARAENFFGPGGRLTYTNVAHLELNAGSGIDVLSVTDSQIAPPATNPARNFTLNLGAGGDVVTIASVDTAFASSITIDGEGDDDTVTINAALTLGSGLSDGNLTVTAETINLNAAVDTTAGLTGDVTFHVGTVMNIAAAGDITAGGNVLIDGVGTLNTAGNITTTGGNVTIETATTLTGPVAIDSAGGNITFGTAATLGGAQNLTLDADTGDIAFNAAVGGTPLLDVVVTAADDVTFDDVFSAESFTHTAGTGTTTFHGQVELTEAAGPALSITTPQIIVNALVRSQTGDMLLTTDDIEVNLGGFLIVVAADGRITLVQQTVGRELELGTNANSATRLSLDADELARIDVDFFQFGDADSGEVRVTDAVDAANIGNFHIITGAGVTSSPTVGTITSNRLAVEAVDDVDLSNLNDVSFLGIHTFGVGSQISYRDVDGFTLVTVDGVGGIDTVDGDVTLQAGGLMTQDIFQFGSIVAKGLQLIGTQVLFTIPTNDVDTLAADVTGTFAFSDQDDLTVGSVQTFGRTETVGITTTGNNAQIIAGQTLSLEEAVDVGTARAALASQFADIADINDVKTKVYAGELVLLADAGIGNARALRTEVGSLAAVNVTSGRIAIDDRSGTALEIATIGFFDGVQNLGLGGISVAHTGPLNVNAQVTAAGGGIALTSRANGGNDDHLAVNAPIALAAGAPGDIVFTAGTDLLMNDAGVFNDVVSAADGLIIGTAGRNITFAPNVRVQSISGAIEGAIIDIPPLLQNVSGPQVANTGDASVTFDYGRFSELRFTATVNWSDGTVDVISLVSPGTYTALHNYTGNPNQSDPAAPIPVIVTLRADSRIRFTGYETTTSQITLNFPGDGVRNVRIDTTVKVRYLTADPPLRIIGEILRAVVAESRSNVYSSGGAAQESADTSERTIILREVLPDGTEGSSVRFDLSALDDLPKIFEKVRNGRYRIYLFEPATQSLRMVMEIDVRDGKPTTPEKVNEAVEIDAGDQAAAAGAEIEAAAMTDDSDVASSSNVASAGLAVGAGLLLSGGAGSWTERVDAAVAKFQKYSRLRRPTSPRRKLPR